MKKDSSERQIACAGEKAMKVFILAVDALEYDFIRMRNYPHLKQEQFVKVEIPYRCMTITEDDLVEPFTPVIWRAIFTGKCEQTEPIPYTELRWKNPLLNFLRELKWIRSAYRFCINKNIFSWDLLERLGFKRPVLTDFEETFIKYAKKPILIHNPLEITAKLDGKPFDSNSDLREIVDVYTKISERERRTTLSRIDEEWDLFVVYTRILDVIGHLFWQKDGVVEKYYTEVDAFAKEIRGRIDDAFMIVLSDHGMQPLRGTRYQGGEHSHYAFASFSSNINSKPPLSILDFYRIIREKLKSE